ncbi:hypothetical protein [Aeoliella sp. SH292]|uniref:hypothetical protein n=1 Tax=Aeoliella sp. SH292 TaxID=3454464 RepID=UPI003F97E4F7
MSRNQNTVEKRRREMDKKLKAEDKRRKRLEPKKPQDESPLPAEYGDRTDDVPPRGV